MEIWIITYCDLDAGHQPLQAFTDRAEAEARFVHIVEGEVATAAAFDDTIAGTDAIERDDREWYWASAPDGEGVELVMQSCPIEGLR